MRYQMNLNEAQEILNESGYILTESRGTAQKWIDEVLALDNTLEDQIEDDLMEYYNAFEADDGMIYCRDVGRDSMAESVFDYVGEDDYENFVSAFGTPEKYVKEHPIA